jgi:hypothetical protein
MLRILQHAPSPERDHRRDSPAGQDRAVETAKGFTLYMVKAVDERRGDGVIDLGKTNLWR